MHMKKPGIEGTTLYPQKYVFLEPARLWVVHPLEDDMQLMGYGIGETIEVLEPSVQLLIASHEEKEFLELADGSIAYKCGEWPTVSKLNVS